jgi:hypothetical protein
MAKYFHRIIIRHGDGRKRRRGKVSKIGDYFFATRKMLLQRLMGVERGEMRDRDF